MLGATLPFAWLLCTCACREPLHSGDTPAEALHQLGLQMTRSSCHTCTSRHAHLRILGHNLQVGVCQQQQQYQMPEHRKHENAVIGREAQVSQAQSAGNNVVVEPMLALCSL